MKIIHLSDVHIGVTDPDSDQLHITNSIIHHFEDNEEEYDFICFTGDIANAGSAEQLATAEEFLVKLAELTGARIILCPGNHDVDRTKANGDTLTMAARSSEDFLARKTGLYKEHKHLDAFKEWVSRMRAEHGDVFLNQWTNPTIDTVRTVVGEKPYHFVCLNTAILSHSNDDEKNLAIDIKAYQDAVELAKSEGALAIVLMHHPSNWLADWCSSKFDQITNRKYGPAILLQGHVHEERTSTVNAGTGQLPVVSSGGALFQGITYPQSFSAHQIQTADSSIALIPKVFNYDPDSGLWHLDPKHNAEIPVRSPRNWQPKPTSPSGRGTPSTEGDTHWQNPFEEVVANDIDASEIPRLFVDSNEHLKVLENNFDSFVEGQRGTGKTMLLRYLSAEVQTAMEDHPNGSLETASFVGVYCRLSQYGFNRTDFEAVETQLRAVNLFEHRLTAFLFSKLVASLQFYYSDSDKLSGDWIRLRKRLSDSLRAPEIDRADTWSSFVESVSDRTDQIMESVDDHLSSLQPGAAPTELNTWLRVSTTFLKYLEAVRSQLKLTLPFYLLLDDFDSLGALQQQVLFTAAAERNYSTLCFKFGSMTYGSQKKITLSGASYRPTHDFAPISLNWVDGGLQNKKGSASYRRAVEDVARKRLEQARWPADLKYATALGLWETGIKYRKTTVRKISEKRYNSETGKKPKSFQSYWDKYKDVDVLRYCQSKKIEVKYAGISQIVDLSSGIYRQFLELNYRIVANAFDNGWTPNGKTKITASIQNTAIKGYSEDLLKSLGESIGDASMRERGSHKVTSQNLANFIDALCRMFHNRLYKSDLQDAAAIDIAIRGQLPQDSYAMSILRIAVRESALHEKAQWYSSKSDTSVKLPTFTLNRRLVPRYSLGVRMQGRVELTGSQIELAATKPDEFVAFFKRLDKKRAGKNNSEGSTQRSLLDE